ncbi:zinc-dependent alcohol dehydrogenase family protein [Acidothermaceae bacterium B102]|nr:zinc-dependent alcohol dehydrogenase family protein [Acidothermaceae bacterium B102]
MPSTMRAQVLTGYGTPLALSRLPVPEPAPGQALVRVVASGVNPLDLKISAGAAAHARPQLPAILGLDLAGVVEAIGEGVTQVVVGDEVYGLTGGVGGVPGSLAELVAVDADLLAVKPGSLTMAQAAALPLVFVTAWEGLVDRARVTAGQRVLVHGGAGGVGHVSIQIARARGAEVFATGRAAHRATIERFGATFIDFETTTVQEYVDAYTEGEGFDVIVDTVGGATLDASFAAARVYTGHVVSALGWGSHSLAPLSFRGATYSGVFTLLPLLTGKGRAHHGEILREATLLADSGQLVPLVDPRVFDLAETNEAHAAAADKPAGKIVVSVAPGAILGIARH